MFASTTLVSQWERHESPAPCHAASNEWVAFVPQAREEEEAALREELVHELSQLTNVRTRFFFL